MTSNVTSEFVAGTRVTGLVPGEVVTITMTEWDDDLCELTYRRREGQQKTRMMYPGDWDNIETVGGFDEDEGSFVGATSTSTATIRKSARNLRKAPLKSASSFSFKR